MARAHKLRCGQVRAFMSPSSRGASRRSSPCLALGGRARRAHSKTAIPARSLVSSCSLNSGTSDARIALATDNKHRSIRTGGHRNGCARSSTRQVHSRCSLLARQAGPCLPRNSAKTRRAPRAQQHLELRWVMSHLPSCALQRRAHLRAQARQTQETTHSAARDQRRAGMQDQTT